MLLLGERTMGFNVSSLLSPKAATKPQAQDDFRHESVSEVIVSEVPLALELAAIHRSLKEDFVRLAPGTAVNLRAAAFITPESTQEFKVTFSRAVDATVAETTINHALHREFDRIGLLFDRQMVHMVFANI